ncbi:exodeoxyribonuclease VII small subunit [Thermaurantiacus tibetensis]|uniref:exodeoxyribonuclease VII small subunit n=1 Tax=Thermaurantiacus tibetensis TaxID=2759035 RepID=UPI00189050C8|nr:exodeoxyribonuclease VII small subunit [Thermaurantiacus tibetensis]
MGRPVGSEGERELSFEEALKRLEAIVRELESGDVPLERAIALYEEGQGLKSLCEARLASAEARIRELQIGADGMPAGERPFAS